MSENSPLNLESNQVQKESPNKRIANYLKGLVSKGRESATDKLEDLKDDDQKLQKFINLILQNKLIIPVISSLILSEIYTAAEFADSNTDEKPFLLVAVATGVIHYFAQNKSNQEKGFVNKIVREGLNFSKTSVSPAVLAIFITQRMNDLIYRNSMEVEQALQTVVPELIVIFVGLTIAETGIASVKKLLKPEPELIPAPITDLPLAPKEESTDAAASETLVDASPKKDQGIQ